MLSLVLFGIIQVGVDIRRLAEVVWLDFQLENRTITQGNFAELFLTEMMVKIAIWHWWDDDDEPTHRDHDIGRDTARINSGAG